MREFLGRAFKRRAQILVSLHIRDVADIFSKTERSRIMSKVRGRGNKATELVLMRLFRQHRLKGWRRHANIPGRPDFVFHAQRVAIFVDGCFWHGCAKHCRMPASNRTYWVAKIGRNMKRDLATRKLLRAAGWRVIRIWEHQLKADATRSIGRIQRSLQRG